MYARERLKSCLVELASVTGPVPVAAFFGYGWGILYLALLGFIRLSTSWLRDWHLERMEDKKNQDADKERSHKAIEAVNVRAHEKDMLEKKQSVQLLVIDRLLAHAQKLKQPITADLTDSGLSFKIGDTVTDLVSPLAAGRAA